MPLPVSPNEIDRQNFVQINQLGEHPPLPQVAIGQRTQQFLPIFLSRFAIAVQQNATRNFLRVFYFNLISQNYWQNNSCVLALKTIADIVEHNLWTTTGDPQQIIAQSVEEGTSVMVAYFAHTYAGEGLSQFIDSNAWNAINQGLERLKQYQMAIGQMQQQMRPAMQPIYPQQGGYYPNAMPQMPNVPFNTNQLPVGHMGGPQMTTFGGPPSQLGSMPKTGVMSDAVVPQMQSGAQFNAPPVHEFRRGIQRGLITPESLETAQQPQREIQVTEIRGGPQQPVSIQQQPIETNSRAVTILDTAGSTPRRPVTVLDGPTQPNHLDSTTTSTDNAVTDENVPDYTITYPEDPYREIIMSDGTICRRAIDSGWTPTFTINAPYPLAYNPKTQLLVYVKTPDGVIRQLLRDLTAEESAKDLGDNGVESYIEHELDPELRQRERDRLAVDRPKSVIDWNRITNLQVEHAKPYSLEVIPGDPEVTVEDDAITFPVPERVEQIVICDDCQSLVALTVLEHPELGKIIHQHPVEMYGTRLEYRLTHTDLHDIINELSRAETFIDVKRHLETLRREKSDDAEIWDIIEERLKSSVNRHLNVGLSIPWKIGSFMEDIATLEEEIRNDYGDVPASVFVATAPSIIKIACNVIPREEEDVSEDVNRITFSSQYSVTSIPNTLEDLAVAFIGHGAVSKETMPELYAFLEAIVNRTEDYPNPFAARYVKTSDNQWLQLDTALLAANTYLISRLE